MYELNNELVAKLRNIVNKLEDIVKTRNIYTNILQDYHDLLKRLENMKVPNVYTREAFDRYVDLYVRLDSIEKILERKSWVTFEELNSILDDLKNNLHNYINSVKKSYQKELFVFSSPIYIALITYIVSAIIYFTTKNGFTMFTLEIILALIALASIFISKYSFEASYAVLSITAIMGIIFTIQHGTRTLYDHYNILLCMTILVISVMNIQASRMIKSKNYKEKIHNALMNLRKLTEELHKTKSEENILRVKELEEKALRIFREIYGDIGEKLLYYKINLLVMHGYKREDALKKIISMYSENLI